MNLKERLDELVEKYNVPSFIDNDPIQFPRRFTLLQDIEISALLTSVITWGRRDGILKDAEKLHNIMSNSPYHYIMNEEWAALKNSRKNIHRTFFEHDMYTICQNLHTFYLENNSLESLFTPGNILDGIIRFGKVTNSRHISSSIKTSPCKRTNLMLLWLVRNDNIVDMGVWKKISPAKLIIPLDIHVSKISREIWKKALPKTDRMSTALQITGYLSEMCPEDPCKYDFALFGLGEEGLSF